MVNLIVAKHDKFNVRASLFFSKDVVCPACEKTDTKYKGKVFGGRTACWKCKSSQLETRNKQVINYYVALSSIKMKEGTQEKEIADGEILNVLELATGKKWGYRDGMFGTCIVCYTDEMIKFNEPITNMDYKVEDLVEKHNDKKAVKLLKEL